MYSKRFGEILPCDIIKKKLEVKVMAENKSDFIRDPKIIEEEMKKMVEHLRQRKGFNIGTNMFEVGKDPNGDVLIFRTAIDSIYDVPSDWKYGVYYMDGGYPKSGFYTMRDGKYMFLPVKNEIDKSASIEYKTPQQVSDAILAENPQIDRTQISFTHEGVIQISGVLNNINLPTTDLHYDEQQGCIVSSIYPDRKFYVEFVRAQEVDINNIGGTSTDQVELDTNKTLSQQPVREFDDTKERPDHKGARIEDYGVDLFDFHAMKYAFEHYKLNELGYVVQKEDDKDVYSLETRRVDNARIEATLELNKIWINAYNTAKTGNSVNNSKGEMDDSSAFAGENSGALFAGFISLINQNSGKKMSEIVQVLFDAYGMENPGTMKMFLIFLSHSSVATVFNLEIDMSYEVAFQKMNELTNKHLKDEFKDLMGLDEMDNEPVMERKFPNNPF